MKSWKFHVMIPQADNFVQVFQNRPWLEFNSTLFSLCYGCYNCTLALLFYYIHIRSGTPYIHLVLSCSYNSGSSCRFWTGFTCHHRFVNTGGNLDFTATGTTFNHINCRSGGVVLFTGFGILISGVSELYRRNRIKAAAYDREKAIRETFVKRNF